MSLPCSPKISQGRRPKCKALERVGRYVCPCCILQMTSACRLRCINDYLFKQTHLSATAINHLPKAQTNTYRGTLKLPAPLFDSHSTAACCSSPSICVSAHPPSAAGSFGGEYSQPSPAKAPSPTVARTTGLGKSDWPLPLLLLLRTEKRCCLVTYIYIYAQQYVHIHIHVYIYIYIQIHVP